MSKALVVLSGGQDSTTCLFWAVEKYGRENVYAVTFDYDQRHRREIVSAKMVARLAGVDDRHEVVKIGPILAGMSPLTNPQAVLEEYPDFETMDKVIGDRIEKTFVPMRNALFLTLAANRAAVLGAYNVVTGVCEADNANYPDCRMDYILSQAETINKALGFLDGNDHRIILETPLIWLTKGQSINLALDTPGAYGALAYSHTAYDGQYPPTGHDHATTLRAEGFRQADWPDPLVLRARTEGVMTYPNTGNYTWQRIEAARKMITDDLALVPGIQPWWREL